MQDLQIEKFNPLKVEITDLVESVKKTVASSTGAKGYELMKENKKILQKKRTETVRLLKDERDGAIQFQKSVISFEKELLKIIDSVEGDLTVKIKEVDEAKKREERKEQLPERREKMATVGINEITDELLLDMDDKAFAEFFLDEKTKYLDKKQAELDEKERVSREKIEAKERKELQEKQVEQAKKDATEKERKRAEQEKEDKLKQEANDKKAKELEDKKLARTKKYQSFLQENGVTKENANIDFFIRENGDTKILYKKVAEFKFKNS